MRKLVLAVALVVASTIAADAQQIGGRYRAVGKNPNGSPYQGVAEIAITSNSTCRIAWNVGNISQGWCMQRENWLVAGYILGDLIGLIIYEIKRDGSLEGTWTIADKPGIGVELLQPMR